MNKRDAKQLIEKTMGHRTCKKIENCPNCEKTLCIKHQVFPSFKPAERRVLKAIVHKTRINADPEKARVLNVEDYTCDASIESIAREADIKYVETANKAIRVLIKAGLLVKKTGKLRAAYTATCEVLAQYSEVKKPWTTAGRMKRYRLRMKELAQENARLEAKVKSMEGAV